MQKPPAKSSSDKKVVAQYSLYQGIIPDPDTLQKYEQNFPGFADRLLSLAEQELKHRQEMEKNANKYVQTTALVGIGAALTSVSIVSYLCYHAFNLGYATQAVSLAIGVITALAGTFLIGKNRSK
jgi:uncharacterized membrane protein